MFHKQLNTSILTSQCSEGHCIVRMHWRALGP